MAPAFKPGDRLQFDSHVGEPQRGDVVSYRSTFVGGQQEMVHRVVGLPGERLERAPDGGLLVNGKPLAEEYLPAGTTTYLSEPVEVPADHWFLLGDNRERSSDSRVTGPIPRADILAKLTKVDPVKGDEEDPCGVALFDPVFPPLTVNANDPPALQLLTLPLVIQQAVNEDVTAATLDATRTDVRDHTARLETLLAEVGSLDRKAAHTVLRDKVIPALRTMIAAESPDEWAARRQALSTAMNHYLQAIEADVLGD
jgi:signal peptidase I